MTVGTGQDLPLKALASIKVLKRHSLPCESDIIGKCVRPVEPACIMNHSALFSLSETDDIPVCSKTGENKADYNE